MSLVRLSLQMVWHVQRPNLVAIVEQHEGKENFVKVALGCSHKYLSKG